MNEHTSLSWLYARCPVWLWPVLAASLARLQAEMETNFDKGAIAIGIRLTPWGWAYIAEVRWPDAERDWASEAYRAVMGASGGRRRSSIRPLGIIVDDSQVNWALEQFGPRRGRWAGSASAMACLAVSARSILAGSDPHPTLSERHMALLPQRAPP